MSVLHYLFKHDSCVTGNVPGEYFTIFSILVHILHGFHTAYRVFLTEAVLLVVTQGDDTHASQTRNRVSSGADKIVVSMAAVPVMAVVLAITAS